MKLLRLTMQGFKSFADKTTVDFADGMTVIVGPNGTGKSNISDAVRWVLGEQNVRNLRGEKTEDIIFSGSEGRKPKNAAEVTLVLDNSHHELPIDTVQVAITRRVMRDGESTFQINRRNCRLKDVQELLSQVGLGKGSMAVIGQNRVDEVLTARPEERRLIFEEVAGISLYRMRKNEGLRKLERTDENMTRVKDLMALLDEQLVTLKEEAEKSKTYHSLMKDKKQIEATMLLLRMTSIRRMLARYENEARSLGDEVIKWKTLLAKLSADQTKLESDELHHQEESRRLSQTLSKQEQEVERSLSDYRVKEETLKHLKESVISLQGNMADCTEEEKALAQRIEEIQEKLAAAKGELEQKTQILSEKEKLHDEVKQKLDEANAKYQKRLASQQQALLDKERWTKEAEHAASDIEQFTKQEQAWAESADKLKEEIERLSSDLTAMEEKKASIEKKLASYEAEGQKYRKLADDKQKKAADIHQKIDELTNQLRRIQVNVQYLERADQEHASFSRTAKVLLDNKNRFGNALIGAVGDLVRVPSRYTDAAEIVLGGSLSHMVTRTSQDAARMIQWLKTNHLGRATFYPLDAVKGRMPSAAEVQAAREQGICGIASDLFQYDPAYANVMQYLLGRTLIAEDLDTARMIAKKYQYRLRIVTLDGQLLSPGGSMTGGSMRKKEQTFFGRKKEAEEGRKQEKELQALIADWVNQEKAAQQEMTNATNQLNICRDAWQEAHTELASLLGQKQGLESNLELEKRNFQSIEDSRKSAGANREQAEKSRKEALEKLSAFKAVEDVPSNEEGAALQVKEEQLSQELMDLRVAKNGIEKDIEFQKTSLQERTADQEKLKHEKADLEQKIQLNQKNSAALQEELTNLNEHTGNLKEKLETIKKEQEDLQNQYDAFVMEKKKNEEAWRDAQSHEAEADKKRAEIDGRAESFKEQERQVLGMLQENGLTLTTAEALRIPGTIEDMKRKKSSVEGSIIRLGNVNPNGEEAYELQLRRKESYETQIDDLQKSKDDLQKVLTDIDKTMTKQFSAGFEEINKEFSRIMQVMFQGGKARLELTDPDHPLEGGVEMYLQLPGKKRQPLSLMSGGERALTVVALLISFMAYHPAPFCFVDEIDAALDDANVERYSRMIGDYKKRTQFIVISHRKKTMEFADTLQGVTMAEKGVSSLITVHMSDYFGDDAG